MTIDFRCIRCGQRLRVAATDRGMRARCPTCGAIVDVPNDSTVSSPIMLSQDKSDVIDYELFGEESQYVEITLDPGEVTAARLENLLYMSSEVAIQSAALDSTSSSDSESGLLGKLSQVGRRILSGSSLTMTAFCNVAEQREFVAFSPARPSRLIPMHLNEIENQVTCQSSAILCVARGIQISDVEVPALGGVAEMQQVNGDGIAVLQAAGQLFHRHLGPKQRIAVKTANIIAYTTGITVQPHENDGVQERTSVSCLSGPGEIWLKTGE